MKNVFVVIIILISLYIGFGGFIILENRNSYDQAMILPADPIEIDGQEYHNDAVFEAVMDQELTQKIFPYSLLIPTVLGFMLTAKAFGVIGAFARIINTCIQEKKGINEVQNLLLIIAQGMLIGVIILGISYTIPVFLTTEDSALKPITIVFLSLFGGINYEHFFNWLTKLIEKNIFKEPETN